MEGFEFAFLPDQSVITLFSAPNYCYEFDNKGAILHVNAKLYCSFTQLDPRTYPVLEEPTDRPGTPPRGQPSPPPAKGCSVLPAEDDQDDDSLDSDEDQDDHKGD
jgi:serine/threonine-protein phosphatase PP1 catalytic subunit